MRDKKNRGFTLAELLVVVAIIAVLVAVSIPIFASQLDKARVATDRANERAAKAAAVVYYQTNEPSLIENRWTRFAYDVENGKIYYIDNTVDKVSKYVKAGYNKIEEGTNSPGTAVVVVRLQNFPNGGLSINVGWDSVK